MGIESVTYWFEPSTGNDAGLAEWLQARGATPRDREGAYVLSGADYWIDLWELPSDSGSRMLHVRVAVTNPASVTGLLRSLFSELVDVFGGTVTDIGSRRVFTDLRDDPGKFDHEFIAKRRRFTEKFGELVLPVSADDVFALLRSRREDEPSTELPPPAASEGLDEDKDVD